MKKLLDTKCSLEKEKLQIRGQMEELMKTHKTDLEILKTNHSQDRYELEQSKDALVLELEMLKTKSRTQESIIVDLRDDLDGKEAELSRAQTIRGHDWSRINELECDKVLLTSRLTTLEGDKQNNYGKQQRMEWQAELEQRRAEQEREIYNYDNKLLIREKQRATPLKPDLQGYGSGGGGGGGGGGLYAGKGVAMSKPGEPLVELIVRPGDAKSTKQRNNMEVVINPVDRKPSNHPQQNPTVKLNSLDKQRKNLYNRYGQLFPP